MTMRTPAVALGRMRRGLAEAECAALDAIEVPTLVVGAGGDLLTTDARAVADAIPGAVFVEIAGAGHAVCLESAAAVTTALERHLRN
jgi:pimeloyl-ACP methyl ester carboxylesterase